MAGGHTIRNDQLFYGLAVTGYERDDEGNGKFLLSRWDEAWSYAGH